MNGMRKAAVCLCLLAGFLAGGTAEASPLDRYRDILLGERYTIRYTDISGGSRRTNKDKVEIVREDDSIADDIDFSRIPLECLVTRDGKSWYMEHGYLGLYDCFARTEGKHVERTRKHGSLGRGGRVGSMHGFVAVEREPDALISTRKFGMMENSYGLESMAKFMNAFLPKEKKSIYTPDYEYVTEGRLSDGRYYVDYKTGTENQFELIRYYFRDDRLVEIKSAEIRVRDNGKFAARRHIVTIEEFSDVPDTECLAVLANAK